MSSTEFEPRPIVKDPHQKAGDLLPPFRLIVQEALHNLDISSAEFTELANLAQKSCEPDDKQIDQVLVDTLSHTILGDKDPKHTLQCATIFDELSQNYVRQGDGKRQTQLLDSAITLVYSELPRKKARKVWGAHTTKSNKVLDFCLELDASPPKDALDAIGEQVVTPVIDLINSTPDPDTLDDYTLEDLEKLLSTTNVIDSQTDMSKLRLSCFVTIYDCLKQPHIQRSLRAILKPERIKKLETPELLAFYQACQIVDDLQRDTDNKSRYRLVDVLKDVNPHRSIVPFIKSKDAKTYDGECERLETACYKYIDLVNAQKWLQKIKNRGNKLEDMRERGIHIIAGRIAVRASGVVLKSNQQLRETKAKVIGDDTEDAEFTENIWEHTLKAESLISTSASELVAQVTELRIKLDHDAKVKLRATTKTPLRDEYDELLRRKQYEEILPEIERYKEQFNSIDMQYRISGKKMRERNPEVINLAKQLSDIFIETDHEPLSQDIARGLSGLMLGIYWERSGKQGTIDKTIQQYLEDARQLRSLSSQLEELGQNVSSNLLRTINLLDEMIDSGVFDDIEDHPEFDKLKDFVLNYIAIRDTKPEIIVEKNEVDPEPQHMGVFETAEEMPTTLSTLPIEVIGQAEEEDIYVFPPGASWREVVSEFSQHLDNGDRYTVQWDRIIKLVELRDHCQKQGLEIDFIRTKHASWQKLPFFVLEVRLPGSDNAIAVVESPVYGNATYIFRESTDRLEWRDAVQLSRQEARELGAVPAVHVDDNNLEVHKKKLWNHIISELTVI